MKMFEHNVPANLPTLVCMCTNTNLAVPVVISDTNVPLCVIHNPQCLWSTLKLKVRELDCWEPCAMSSVHYWWLHPHMLHCICKGSWLLTPGDKPFSACVGLISDCRCWIIDLFSELVYPQLVLNWADQFIIYLNGLQTGQGFQLGYVYWRLVSWVYASALSTWIEADVICHPWLSHYISKTAWILMNLQPSRTVEILMVVTKQNSL